MSKGMRRFLLICAIVFAAGCVISITGFVTGGISGLSRISNRYVWFVAPSDELKTVYLDTSDVKKTSSGQLFDRIKIEGDADVTICSGDTARTASTSGKNVKAPEMYIEKGVLYIKYKAGDSGVINLSGKDTYPGVKVFCGSDWTLKSIDIDGSGGDYSISDVKVSDISADCGSGDLDMKAVHFGKADIKAGSGDTDIESSEGSSLKLKSGSGDIMLKDTAVADSDISADSGEVDIEGISSRYLKAATGSGDCNIQGVLKGTTDVSTKSGDVDIETELSRDAYELVTDVRSGEISIDRDDDDEDSHGSKGTHHAKDRQYTIKVKLDTGDLQMSFR